MCVQNNTDMRVENIIEKVKDWFIICALLILCWYLSDFFEAIENEYTVPLW